MGCGWPGRSFSHSRGLPGIFFGEIMRKKDLLDKIGKNWDDVEEIFTGRDLYYEMWDGFIPIPKNLSEYRCLRCSGRMLIRAWRFHQRLRSQLTKGYRCDVYLKCMGPCSKVDTHGVALRPLEWTKYQASGVGSAMTRKEFLEIYGNDDS